MALVLLILLQDPDALLRQLRDPDLERREKAEAALIELGEAGIPALQRLGKDPDPEFRERVRHILAEVAILEQRRSVHPNRTRITRRLEAVPLEEALTSLLQPFGLSVRPPGSFSERAENVTLTVDLQEAGFWDLVRALETKAGIDLDFTRTGVDVRTKGQNSRAFRYFHQGELRLRLETTKKARDAVQPVEMAIEFTAMLPPGALPVSWRVEGLRLRDEAGMAVEVKPHPSFPDPSVPSRNQGELTMGGLGESVATVAPNRPYRLSGVFVSTYPSRIVRHPFNVRSPGGAPPLIVQGVRCSVALDPSKEIRETYEILEDGPPRRFLLWAEGPRGKWLEDRSRILLGDPKGGTSERHGALDHAASMDRMILGELVGEQRVSIPFEFENVSVPSK